MKADGSDDVSGSDLAGEESGVRRATVQLAGRKWTAAFLGLFASAGTVLGLEDASGIGPAHDDVLSASDAGHEGLGHSLHAAVDGFGKGRDDPGQGRMQKDVGLQVRATSSVSSRRGAAGSEADRPDAVLLCFSRVETQRQAQVPQDGPGSVRGNRCFAGRRSFARLSDSAATARARKCKAVGE